MAFYLYRRRETLWYAETTLQNKERMVKKAFSKVSEVFDHSKAQKAAIRLEGMIKESDNSETVLYTPGGCEEWIEIPQNIVSDIDYLFEKRCIKPGEEPHSHPYVRLIVNTKDAKQSQYLKAISTLIRGRRIEIGGGARSVSPENQVWTRSDDNSENGYGAAPMESSKLFRYPGASQRVGRRSMSRPFFMPQYARQGQRGVAAQPQSFDCGDGEDCVYYEGCPYHCACVNDEGLAYCSGCCVATPARRSVQNSFFMPQYARRQQRGFAVRPYSFDCGEGEDCVYYEGCPYHCACVNDEGWAYCSGCCVS